jgi:hypothetical protein
MPSDYMAALPEALWQKSKREIAWLLIFAFVKNAACPSTPHHALGPSSHGTIRLDRIKLLNEQT